jgi:predicted DNA-binding protein with PD1-like motif
MRSKLLYEAEGLRTFGVVFDKGDEAKSGLEAFAREHGVSAASLTAIGAFQEATLAYFDPEALEYRDIPVARQVEVLSLVGDVALKGDEPQVHAHVVVGKPDGSTAGGHLKAGTVWPTLEVIVRETPAHLHKRVDQETGLALIDPSA